MTVAAPPAPTPGSRVNLTLSGIGLIVAVLALPVVLIAGGPVVGWLVGVGLWAANWAAQILTNRFAFGLSPTTAVGMAGVSFISRAWLVAIVLFVIALRVSEPVGLTAAGVFLAAFTCDLVGRTMLHGARERARQDVPR